MAEDSRDELEPLTRRSSRQYIYNLERDSHNLLVLEDEHGFHRAPPREGATVLQAVFNVVNIFIGMGMLSMPYAVMLGGWLSLGALVVAAAVFCVSGLLIVKNFDKVPAGMPHTYPALGVCVLGPSGRYVVGVSTVAEFFGASCIMLVILWKEIETLMDDSGVLGMSVHHTAIIVGTLAIAPLLFIPSFKKLSWLSMAGCLSTVLVTITVVAAVALDPKRDKMPTQPPAGHTLVKRGILEAFGIFAISVSGHTSLPVLRNSMKNPKDFNKVIYASFAAMAMVYGLVAGLGYYYFGDAASTLVTNDLAIDSPFTGHWLLVRGLTVDKVVVLCILVNAYTTYPCLVLVIQDMLWAVLAEADGLEIRAPKSWVAVATRLLICGAGAVVGYLTFDVLGNVMSLVGALCAMNSSLLMPAAFFLVLFWRDLGALRRAGTATLLALGLALLVMIVVQNVQSLIAQAHGSPTSDARGGGGGGGGSGGGGDLSACSGGWALNGWMPSALLRQCI
ncbi:hypothetical protein WJX81_006348 [Elliptochloris bilobata]|uniref:Amino acid transporter transmembrane domain-containing protein n=1 Tax=Elliptochloris bilobata TaxID=381761 RepID=A0AAW1QW27_9CHLO